MLASNATLPCSVAFYRAHADSLGISLASAIAAINDVKVGSFSYQFDSSANSWCCWFGGVQELKAPMPVVSMLSGGVLAPGNGMCVRALSPCCFVAHCCCCLLLVACSAAWRKTLRLCRRRRRQARASKWLQRYQSTTLRLLLVRIDFVLLSDLRAPAFADSHQVRLRRHLHHRHVIISASSPCLPCFVS